jgi:hypothetical protein
MARFQPGNIANPHGRPRKDESPTEKLREFRKLSTDKLEKLKPKDGIEEEAKLEILAARKAAENKEDGTPGDIDGIEKVRNRCEGKPRESVELDANVRQHSPLMEAFLSDLMNGTGA